MKFEFSCEAGKFCYASKPAKETPIMSDRFEIFDPEGDADIRKVSAAYAAEMKQALAKARFRVSAFLRAVRELGEGDQKAPSTKNRLAVISGLLSFFGPAGIFPSYRTMEIAFGMKDQTIKEVIDWAIEQRLLSVKKHGVRNTYQIYW